MWLFLGDCVWDSYSLCGCFWGIVFWIAIHCVVVSMGLCLDSYSLCGCFYGIVFRIAICCVVVSRGLCLG